MLTKSQKWQKRKSKMLISLLLNSLLTYILLLTLVREFTIGFRMWHTTFVEMDTFLNVSYSMKRESYGV